MQLFSLAAAFLFASSITAVVPVTDMEPAVANDGMIAFASNRDGAFDIYVIDKDHKNLRKLTSGGGKDTPAWSPDNQHIAFSWERDGKSQIFLVPRTGGLPVQISNGAGNDLHPFFSADGKSLTFTRFLDNRLFLMRMTADGKNPTILTKGLNASYGSLSPDGSKLVYWRDFDGNAEIAVSGADGKNEQRLTNNGAFDGWPTWAPDGKAVVFARDSENIADIFTLDLDSKEERRLTQGVGRRTSPKWSPDGKSIYFAGAVDGRRGIWVLKDEQERPDSKTR